MSYHKHFEVIGVSSSERILYAQGKMHDIVCTHIYGIISHTLEHPGVNAPGTAKRIPLLPANKSFMFTTVFGVPSCSSTDGRASPTYRSKIEQESRVQDNNFYSAEYFQVGR